MAYPTHEQIERAEQYILEVDLEAVFTEKLRLLHIRVCDNTNRHIAETSGPNKGKCKYCLRAVAVPIEEPEPIPGPGPGP